MNKQRLNQIIKEEVTKLLSEKYTVDRETMNETYERFNLLMQQLGKLEKTVDKNHLPEVIGAIIKDVLKLKKRVTDWYVFISIERKVKE